MPERPLWPFLWLLGGALAALLPLLVLSGGGAQEPSVHLQPGGLAVPPGGTANVQIVGDPPGETLAAWIIDLTFDASVVTTTREQCDTPNIPAEALGGAGCEPVDNNGDGRNDTIKIFGAALYSGGQGLTGVQTFADITFQVTGAAGSCSPLTLAITAYTDPGGAERPPQVTDGRLCVRADAPPAGSEIASESTPHAAPTGQGGGPASSRAGGASAATMAPAAAPVAQTPGDGGGGGGAVIWVILGALALGGAGGAAWWLARERSQSSAG
jgi:hypothetical protein